MLRPAAFRAASVPLVVYAALFPLLALDVVARLVSRSAILERGNLALLLTIESAHALRGILGLLLVALLLGALVQQPWARALALALLFGLIGYAIAFASGGYAGPFQEWLTGALLGLGVPRSLLAVLFGHARWAFWFSLAGLIRFSVLFPEPLGADTVAGSGAGDRAGLLRRVPGAGLDVGSLFRRLAATFLRSGWLNALPVWLAAAAGALLSIALRTTPLRASLWLPFFLGVALAVTCLRATYVAARDPQTKHELRLLARGALAALFLFALAGVLGLNGGPGAAVAVFVLLTIAPIVFLLALGRALLQRRRSVKLAPSGS